MATFTILGDDVVIGNDFVLGACINGKPIFMIPTSYLKSVLLILSQNENYAVNCFIYQIQHELDERESNSRKEICAIGELPPGRDNGNSLCADDTYYRLFALVMSDILKFSIPKSATEVSVTTGYFSMVYQRRNEDFPYKDCFTIEVGPPGGIGDAKWFEKKKEFNNWHSAIVYIIDKYWKNP